MAGGATLIGKTSHDIDSTDTIIDFFEKHPTPSSTISTAYAAVIEPR